MIRKLEVSVILQHACIVDVWFLRHFEAVEALVHIIERLGKFNGTVASEVVEDDRIAVIDRTDRLAVFGYDEAGRYWSV